MAWPTSSSGGAGAQINITGVIGHAAFESDGGGATNIGGWWTGNSVEMVGYMDAGIYFRKSNAFHLDNLFFDGTGRTFYYFGEQAGNNKLVAYNNTGVLQSGPSAAYNTIECAAATGGGCQTTFPYQVKFLTPITLPIFSTKLLFSEYAVYGSGAPSRVTLIILGLVSSLPYLSGIALNIP
jgi:hypothetical protein